MANDPSKAELWPFADVLVAPIGSPIPASENDPFSGAWKYVGCLDGDAGFPFSRNWDKSDKFFWGGGVLRVIRRNFKLTAKFTAYEGANEVVDDLAWPNKVAGTDGAVVGVPYPERILIAFELREGEKVKRLISEYQVEVDLIGDMKAGESDVTGYEFEATIFAGPAGGLLRRQPAPDAPELTALTISPDPATVADGEIAKLTATATFSSGPSRDVTLVAVWDSSDETNATVEAGYVTGVDSGTSAISAMFGDQADTVTVTVTA